MFILGLTGGVGSGKTAASNFFEDKGIVVVDADVVAREVVEPGTDGLRQIIDHFGSEIILPDGSLDRASLRTLIFNHPASKQKLESILHPVIREEVKSQLENAASAYAILVSPLLFETNQHQLVQRSLLIDAPVDLQVARAAKRDNSSEEQIRKIIATQMSRKDKLEKADDIILNDRDLKHLYKQLETLHQRYLAMA